jgi:hypothetical protein
LLTICDRGLLSGLWERLEGHPLCDMVVRDVLLCDNGITNGLLGRLQGVAGARLVTGVGRCEHIASVVRQQHWLPVCQSVQFKLATLVYRSLAGTAPAYLSDECHLTLFVAVRSLRSADSRTCVPHRAPSSYGDRCLPLPVLFHGIVCRSSNNRILLSIVLKLYYDVFV